MDKTKKKPAAFIFDLDGTIVDTQTNFHAAAECAVLKEICDIKIAPESISSVFAGISTKRVFQSLAPNFDPEILLKAKWKHMVELAEKKPIQYLPKMHWLISFLHTRNIPISIGSASPVEWINTCLTKAFDENEFSPLDEVFSGLVASAEDCKNPKPAPDVFLYALNKMFLKQTDKTEKHEVYVVGDGRADVLAGLAIGAKVLYLSPDVTKFDDHPDVKRFHNNSDLAEYAKSLI